MAGDAALVVICFVSEFQRRSAFRDGDVVKRRRRRTRATTAMGEKDGEQAPPNAQRRTSFAVVRRRSPSRDGERATATANARRRNDRHGRKRR